MEYFPGGSQIFSADDADDANDAAGSTEADGYSFEGYTVEVNKKIELTPSAPPKTK